MLGPEHPDTLTSADNVANTRRALGDTEGARQLLEEVYEIRQRVLGLDHPNTLVSAHSLAETRRAPGGPRRP